jgi:uncharacterized protein YndB with AHSA1/START domain
LCHQDRRVTVLPQRKPGYYVCYVAIRASREVVIDAPPEAIMDALADIKAVPSWSSVHKRAQVIDTYADGRPHHVKVTAKLMGIVDTEVLEYHWGPNWLVWDAEPTDRQHGQHVEYTLQPEGGGTRVRFDITLEPSAPVLEFLVKRGEKIVLDDATEGLRKRVLG